MSLNLNPVPQNKLFTLLNGTFGGLLLLSLICIILFTLVPESVLAFRRVEISHGQWWRLVTGNLMHTNHWHLLMNLAGLWTIGFLFEFKLSLFKFLVLFLCLCTMEGASLYWFYPQLQGYVGLSGILHGLFSYGAVREIFSGIKMGYLLLLGVILKTGYEHFFGASAEVIQMIGAKVAVDAHLVGMCCGIIIAIIVSALKIHLLTSK